MVDKKEKKGRELREEAEKLHDSMLEDLYRGRPWLADQEADKLRDSKRKLLDDDFENLEKTLKLVLKPNGANTKAVWRFYCHLRTMAEAAILEEYAGLTY